jgi:phosphoglycerate-specific signal transduction histidine kinase
MLEQIEARDQELLEKNSILASEIGERKEAQRRFEQAHQQLLAASRRAGMAEVATDVLHNVGNVLNSLNLTTEMINEKLKQSKLEKLTLVGQMLENNQERIS